MTPYQFTSYIFWNLDSLWIGPLSLALCLFLFLLLLNWLLGSINLKGQIIC